MSHRISTQTNITNAEYAISAMATAGVAHKAVGDSKFEITTGRSTATLDLSTGNISGDNMYWKPTDFDGLRQAYAEEVLTWELRRAGASIESREITKEGDIVITYQTTG